MTNDTTTTTAMTPSSQAARAAAIAAGAAGAAPPALGDPRPAFAKVVALGGTVIDGVRPAQLTDPTPCDAYDVRLLLGHLVSVLRRVAAVARGESPFSVPQETAVADDAWKAAWLDAAHEVQEAWTDDAVLDRPLVLPFATLPGRIALAIYVSEVTVHTWDLAVATQQRPAWNDEIVLGALQMMQGALPAGERGGEIPFGPVVAVADDAAPIDRLVAWLGRTPV